MSTNVNHTGAPSVPFKVCALGVKGAFLCSFTLIPKLLSKHQTRLVIVNSPNSWGSAQKRPCKL